MRVIIIGGGQVGRELARRLSTEHQDVVLVEKHKRLVDRLSNTMDVMLVHGDGASIRVLDRAGVKKCDLLIAATQSDETNIIACMIAKQFGVPKTVARIRNDEFTNGQQILSHKQLGIDIVINPESVAAEEIMNIIENPLASEVARFSAGEVKLVSTIITPHSPFVNKRLMDLPIAKQCVIGAIVRNGNEVLIPRGDDLIKSYDRLYIIGCASEDVGLIDSSIPIGEDGKNIVIVGGSRLGAKLARLLEEVNGTAVKIIEQDAERCEELLLDLNRTLVLNGGYTDTDFLKHELADCNVLVALTMEDQTNLFVSLFAKKKGVNTAISQLLQPEYGIIFSGVDHVINPQLSTVAGIMKLIRKSDVLSVTILDNDQAEIVELVVPEGAAITGKSLAEAGLPRGINIGVLSRGGTIIFPRGATRLLAGDQIIVFTKKEQSGIVDDIFQSKPSKRSGFFELNLNRLAN